MSWREWLNTLPAVEIEDGDGVNKKEAVENLVESSHVGEDFYLLLVVSAVITTLGLLENTAAVVIGGMVIAPVLSPILALGLSMVTGSRDAFLRSVLAILKVMLLGTLLAFMVAAMVGVEQGYNFEILQRGRSTVSFVFIAIFSGVAASYSWAKPRLSVRLPGVAVVVALLPPLGVAGIGLAELDYGLVEGALKLFLVNMLGIAGSAAVVFSLLGFHKMRRLEEKKIEKIDE